MNLKKRILIVSEPHLIKTFILPTIKRLRASNRDVQFDCFTVGSVSEKDRQILSKNFERVHTHKNLSNSLLAKIPRFKGLFLKFQLWKSARGLPKYDIIHIQFHHSYFSLFTPILRKKAAKLYITFFGSDFNEITKAKHKRNLISVNISDAVFATNLSLLDRINEEYGLQDKGIKRGTLIPLMETFERFENYLANKGREKAKNEWGVNNEEIMIVCGYNAASITRHDIIIDALADNRELISSSKIFFPMAYGQNKETNIRKVREQLDKLLIDAAVLSDYLELKKLYALRTGADIFIHIQQRDQMAASMLEHLAAGSVVITGNWLPYKSLKDKGIFMIFLDDPEKLSNILPEVIEKLDHYREKASNNREIVLSMMDWDVIKNNWHYYYELNNQIK